MSRLCSRLCPVVMWALVACGTTSEAPLAEAPELSHAPRWMLEAPSALRESCFGHSLALGDLDGDGQRELVVAAPPCQLSTGRGHVAVYAGRAGAFSSEPVIAELDWRHAIPNLSGTDLRVSTGDVDGDRFGDLLVTSLAGVMVFSGREDLGEALREPRFRVPGRYAFRGGHLEDLDGDGLDDVISVVAQSGVSLYLSRPGDSAGPFVLAGTLSGQGAVRAGDADGDGLGDVVVRAADGSRLHRGCRAGSAGCEGGVVAEPLWRVDGAVLGLLPDQNGDGRAEAVLGERSRLSVRLSEPGGLSPTPAASLLGDVMYPNLGAPLLPVPSLDGDPRGTELVVGAEGRLYLYTLGPALPAAPRPAWAWPQADGRGPDFQGYVRPSVAAGDLDGNGHDELLVGFPPTPSQPRAGRVLVFAGGRVPEGAAAPYLPEPATCAPRASGKPDVTVDADLLARSAFIERREFEPSSCEYAEGCVLGPGLRRLLRFSVSIPNLGAAPATVPTRTQAPELYQYDACHQHDHLVGFAGYELRDARDTVTAVGRKQGFFLLDFAPTCLDSPSLDFGAGTGISPGWADVYTSEFACQWLDITDVPDGAYTLRVSVDQNDVIDEDDVHPNTVTVRLRLSGDSVEVVRE